MLREAITMPFIVTGRVIGAQAGQTIILDGERYYVRERDRSVLSRNLGLLLCAESTWIEGHDDGSFWTTRTDYEIDS